MATIKSYTDISQSKTLSNILPLESADMCYINGDPGKIRIGEWGNNVHDEDDIPCWSLAALLKTLNFPSLTQNKEYEWEVCVFDHDNDDYIEKTASNPVDACYNLILKLHELKML